MLSGRLRASRRALAVGVVLLAAAIPACPLDTASRMRCRDQADCLEGYCCVERRCRRGPCQSPADSGVGDAASSCTRPCLEYSGECGPHEICSPTGRCQPACDPYSCAAERESCYVGCDGSDFFASCVDPAVNMHHCANVHEVVEPDPEGPFIVEAFLTAGPADELGCDHLLRYTMVVQSEADMEQLVHSADSTAVRMFDTGGYEQQLHPLSEGGAALAVEPSDRAVWRVGVAVCEEEPYVGPGFYYTAFIRDPDGRWSNGLCFPQLVTRL